MITGAHAIIYSRDADADRAFLRDVLELPGIDAGGGWLIFGLPPSEVAVHPAERSGTHELYLICDDVHELARALRARKIRCSAVRDRGWGLIVSVTLPGGGRIGSYQPQHRRPPSVRRRAGGRKKSGSTRRGPTAAGR